MGSQTSHASPLSAGSKVTGGFFSALGRNSSTRKDSIISKPAQPLPRLSEATSVGGEPATGTDHQRTLRARWSARFSQPSAALADANAGTVACGLRDRPVAASHVPPKQHLQISDGPPPVRNRNRERQVPSWSNGWLTCSRMRTKTSWRVTCVARVRISSPSGNTSTTRRTDPYAAIDVFVLCARPHFFCCSCIPYTFPPPLFFVALHFASCFATQFFISHFSIHSNSDS